jgi:hypothetical protein
MSAKPIKSLILRAAVALGCRIERIPATVDLRLP